MKKLGIFEKNLLGRFLCDVVVSVSMDHVWVNGSRGRNRLKRVRPDPAMVQYDTVWDFGKLVATVSPALSWLFLESDCPICRSDKVLFNYRN